MIRRVKPGDVWSTGNFICLIIDVQPGKVFSDDLYTYIELISGVLFKTNLTIDYDEIFLLDTKNPQRKLKELWQKLL